MQTDPLCKESVGQWFLKALKPGPKFWYQKSTRMANMVKAKRPAVNNLSLSGVFVSLRIRYFWTVLAIWARLANSRRIESSSLVQNWRFSEEWWETTTSGTRWGRSDLRSRLNIELSNELLWLWLRLKCWNHSLRGKEICLAQHFQIWSRNLLHSRFSVFDQFLFLFGLALCRTLVLFGAFWSYFVQVFFPF